MVEGGDQSARVEKLLAKLEALIRNGVPIDVPQVVNKHLKKYEKLTPDERERFVGTMIELFADASSTWSLRWRGQS